MQNSPFAKGGYRGFKYKEFYITPLVSFQYVILIVKVGETDRLNLLPTSASLLPGFAEPRRAQGSASRMDEANRDLRKGRN